MSQPLFKPLLLVTLVLIVPVVLLAATGDSFGMTLALWRTTPASTASSIATRAAAVIAILALDIVLPVPSGPVATLAGSQLGIPLGTAAATLGMTLGATIAFAAARRWGRPLAERISSPEQLAAIDDAGREHGPWMLIATRPLPIIAEAAALVAGSLRMPWRAFLPPVIAANLAVAAAYATLGSYAVEQGWLPLAFCVTIAAPLGLAILWRRTR